LDLKTVLSNFCGQSFICELILALVSLWLLVNSSKDTFKEKNVRLIFLLFYSKYFDYFIIFFPVEDRRMDEERRRTMENLHEIAHKNVSEALRKYLGLDFLHANMFFHPKQLKMHSIGVSNPLEQPPLAYL